MASIAIGEGAASTATGIRLIAAPDCCVGFGAKKGLLDRQSARREERDKNGRAICLFMQSGLTSGMTKSREARQRLDKWLWFARIVKSRTLAAKLVTGGRIRVNAARIENPAKAVGPGDVLTIALEREVKVLRILANAERRGPYSEARLLYNDMNARETPDEPSQGF